MNNTVGIKSVLTGIFLILTFLPALEVRAFGHACSAVGGGNQIGDEDVATENLPVRQVADRTAHTGSHKRPWQRLSTHHCKEES